MEYIGFSKDARFGPWVPSGGALAQLGLGLGGEVHLHLGLGIWLGGEVHHRLYLSLRQRFLALKQWSL